MVFSGSFHTFNFACITASWRTLRKIKTDIHAVIILWSIARILRTHFFCHTICCIFSVCIRNSGGFIFARTKTTRRGRTETNGTPGQCVLELKLIQLFFNLWLVAVAVCAMCEHDMFALCWYDGVIAVYRPNGNIIPSIWFQFSWSIPFPRTARYKIEAIASITLQSACVNLTLFDI